MQQMHSRLMTAVLDLIRTSTYEFFIRIINMLVNCTNSIHHMYSTHTKLLTEMVHHIVTNSHKVRENLYLAGWLGNEQLRLVLQTEVPWII